MARRELTAAFAISAIVSCNALAESALPLRQAAPVDADRIASRVFDVREGGANVGSYFVRFPDGHIFARERSAVAEDQAALAREFFRLSIQVKLAERQIWLKDAHRRREAAKRAPREAERKPLTAFFTDDTLSPGDVVVAVEGFRVFKGSANFPWRASDFVPLDAWNAQGGGARRGLRDMERESKRRGL